MSTWTKLTRIINKFRWRSIQLINVSFIPKCALFYQITFDAWKRVVLHLLDKIVEVSLLRDPLNESDSIFVSFKETKQIFEKTFFVQPPDCFFASLTHSFEECDLYEVCLTFPLLACEFSFAIISSFSTPYCPRHFFCSICLKIWAVFNLVSSFLIGRLSPSV